MKKILLSISIILFTITLPLSAMSHERPIQNHQTRPLMLKDTMINTANIEANLVKLGFPHITLHLQGVVDMSEELIKKSKDAELKAFAQKMIDAQKAEVKMMQGWLKKIEKK